VSAVLQHIPLIDPLNDRQLKILRWIGDGCPPDVMDGYTYKHTARSLQDRKLVYISKRSGRWAAISAGEIL
jgi:hypothetical protein